MRMQKKNKGEGKERGKSLNRPAVRKTNSLQIKGILGKGILCKDSKG